MAQHRLDARYLLCPLPVIRTQQKVAQLEGGDRLQIVATDPGVLEDIPAWCEVHGHRYHGSRREKEVIYLEIEVSRQ